MDKAKILLVEDEADLALIVSDTLRGYGYEVSVACDGFDGLEKFRRYGADIVVADVMMPRLDGFEMARNIRAVSMTVPLLFLTAKNSIDDIEEGFEIGADDYLKKPFELRELIVRIKALLRRHDNSVPGDDDVIFRFGAYVFDVSTQMLPFGGKDVGLSNIEARLLERLAMNIGKTVYASDLMIAVWQRDDLSNRNSLHGYIHKLRHLLRHDQAVSIINQRGFGYMLCANQE